MPLPNVDLVQLASSVVPESARGPVDEMSVVSAFPAQHSKYVVVDGMTVETGSYNYSQQAARYNAENVVVLRGDTRVADAYLKNWEAVSARGELYRAP
ncbi:phospholipase D-like domain-containing protein [Burkholderia gladioli]|uniref:phospholipase D-like domain-containing protein n=1 Tax=Burkholderia gladioli TaxID=28095 RepID=UPI001FC86E32|nr:phospholipase D-like domain-containing protein [Burkholderia gladioli]